MSGQAFPEIDAKAIAKENLLRNPCAAFSSFSLNPLVLVTTARRSPLLTRQDLDDGLAEGRLVGEVHRAIKDDIASFLSNAEQQFREIDSGEALKTGSYDKGISALIQFKLEVGVVRGAESPALFLTIQVSGRIKAQSAPRGSYDVNVYTASSQLRSLAEFSQSINMLLSKFIEDYREARSVRTN